MTNDKTALDALDRLENDALSGRDGYGDARKDAEIIRNFINTRPQPSGDAVKALDEVLKRYKNEIKYLEEIKRTEFGNDMLHTYKKFVGKLEPVRAALTQPKADVEGLKKDTSNTQELLAKCEDFTVGYNNGWNAAIDSLAAQGYIGVPECFRTLLKYAEWQIEDNGNYHPTLPSCVIECQTMLKAAPKKEETK